jgi:hypothetical protein
MQRSITVWLSVLIAGCASGEPQPHVRLPLVRLESVTFGDQGAIVRWFVLDETVLGSEDVLGGPSPITRFSLEREDLVTGKRILLAEALPSTSRTYDDRGIDVGGKYRYRLSYHVAGGSSATVESDPFDGPNAWTLQFSNPMNASGKGAVFVRIRKFEKGVGLVDASRIHFEGDRIGWWKEATDAVVSQHRVKLPGGQSLSVDFNTGATLIAVKPVKREVEVRRCKSIFDLSGRKLGCDKVVEKRNFDCHEISFRDSEGDHQTDVPDPRLLSQLCPEHQTNPAAPPAEPRLFEARLLLDKADQLWDVDSAASIKLYQRLIREYKDVVIRLQVRNKVESRARQADD